MSNKINVSLYELSSSSVNCESVVHSNGIRKLFCIEVEVQFTRRQPWQVWKQIHLSLRVVLSKYCDLLLFISFSSCVVSLDTYYKFLFNLEKLEEWVVENLNENLLRNVKR